ncbi:hypothetical protein TNCV_3576141 [Trichonephila clavipes]|nr:hypothetical protein TNCV_3576141 [Trichonephila clavipes]
MARNRFNKLKSYLHFVDNGTTSQHAQDRSFKVKPLFALLNSHFMKFGGQYGEDTNINLALSIRAVAANWSSESDDFWLWQVSLTILVAESSQSVVVPLEVDGTTADQKAFVFSLQPRSPMWWIELVTYGFVAE